MIVNCNDSDWYGTACSEKSDANDINGSIQSNMKNALFINILYSRTLWAHARQSRNTSCLRRRCPALRHHNLLTSSKPPDTHCLISCPAIAVIGGTLVNPSSLAPSPSPGFLSDGASALAVSRSDLFFSSSFFRSAVEYELPVGEPTMAETTERENHWASNPKGQWMDHRQTG